MQNIQSGTIKLKGEYIMAEFDQFRGEPIQQFTNGYYCGDVIKTAEKISLRETKVTPKKPISTYWERRCFVNEIIMKEMLTLLSERLGSNEKEYFDNLINNWDDMILKLEKDNE